MIGLRSGLAASAAILLILTGCRSPQPPEPEAELRGPEGLRVVVAPMNLPIQLAPDLEDAVDPVMQELLRYLAAHDARVSTIFGPDAWGLWRESEEALQHGSEATPDVASVASVFSRALARESSFDALVLPSLVYREARVAGRHAQWDGVRRRLRFRVAPGTQTGRSQPVADAIHTTDPAKVGPAAPDYRGRITGLSLHALVFTPDGRVVFQGFGGLDLVHDPVHVRDAGGDGPSLRLHATLLDKPEHVREGVALTLDPYLVPSPSR